MSQANESRGAANEQIQQGNGATAIAAALVYVGDRLAEIDADETPDAIRTLATEVGGVATAIQDHGR